MIDEIEMHLDPESEELYRRGMAAESLMNSEAFRLTFDELELRYYREWMSSTNVEERERIHHRTTVLKDFAGELVGRVLAKDQIAHRMEQAEQDQSQELNIEEYVDNDY